MTFEFSTIPAVFFSVFVAAISGLPAMAEENVEKKANGNNRNICEFEGAAFNVLRGVDYDGALYLSSVTAEGLEDLGAKKVFGYEGSNERFWLSSGAGDLVLFGLDGGGKIERFNVWKHVRAKNMVSFDLSIGPDADKVKLRPINRHQCSVWR